MIVCLAWSTSIPKQGTVSFLRESIYISQHRKNEGQHLQIPIFLSFLSCVITTDPPSFTLPSLISSYFTRERRRIDSNCVGYGEQNKIMSVVHYGLSDNKMIPLDLMFNMLDHFLYNGHHRLRHISFHLWETSTPY